jgi:hypothetical protein
VAQPHTDTIPPATGPRTAQMPLHSKIRTRSAQPSAHPAMQFIFSGLARHGCLSACPPYLANHTNSAPSSVQQRLRVRPCSLIGRLLPLLLQSPLDQLRKTPHNAVAAQRPRHRSAGSCGQPEQELSGTEAAIWSEWAGGRGEGGMKYTSDVEQLNVHLSRLLLARQE